MKKAMGKILLNILLVLGGIGSVVMWFFGPWLGLEELGLWESLMGFPMPGAMKQLLWIAAGIAAGTWIVGKILKKRIK